MKKEDAPIADLPKGISISPTERNMALQARRALVGTSTSIMGLLKQGLPVMAEDVGCDPSVLPLIRIPVFSKIDMRTFHSFGIQHPGQVIFAEARKETWIASVHRQPVTMTDVGNMQRLLDGLKAKKQYIDYDGWVISTSAIEPTVRTALREAGVRMITDRVPAR
jgi:hypothetical protein